MFDLRRYYEKENDPVKSSYEKTLMAIKDVCNETRDYEKASDKKEYYRFFNAVGSLILKLADHEKNLTDEYPTSKTFEQLLQENNEFYHELVQTNYQRSYANPTHCVKVFGDMFGQLMSYFYCAYRQYILYAYYHKIFKMEEYNKVFLEIFNYVRNDAPEYNILKALITQLQRKNRTRDMVISLKEQFDLNYKYLKEIVEGSTLSDLRYLFRYGRYITDNEVKTARFLSAYPAQKIKKLSNQITNAYIAGFLRDNKDISKKTTVGIKFNIGQERIVSQVIKDLKEHSLETTVNGVSSTKMNRQYNYDHRFDAALFLDEAYTNLFKRNFETAAEQCKETLSMYSGVISLEKFGETPFTPENKQDSLKFTKEQQKLYQVHQNDIVSIYDKYMPHKETSFTIISFPSPEIGKNFGHIFEDILEVNMLNTEHYEHIQQKIIDVLDKAVYVHIKGNNKTDIKVKMKKINDPYKETNFLNCGADINIPVGEVFTSPQLSGTHGTLHVEETYLKGLKFIDLELTFKDGYIVDYNCNNFENERDNKRYIEENLLFPHKTLPLGEFAIGTNTLAYVIAKKYNIVNVLPVLIIEKMGPHFAIGDTCFALREDTPLYNRFNNKEIIARENEKTALRKTKMNEAYAYRHTDITLPYESIEFIAAIAEKGEKINIMKNGKFVLQGTEELNRPFETSR